MEHAPTLDLARILVHVILAILGTALLAQVGWVHFFDVLSLNTIFAIQLLTSARMERTIALPPGLVLSRSLGPFLVPVTLGTVETELTAR